MRDYVRHVWKRVQGQRMRLQTCKGDQSGHYVMVSFPVFSADHSLNTCVLKLPSPVVQSSPVQSSVYTLPICLPSLSFILHCL